MPGISSSHDQTRPDGCCRLAIQAAALTARVGLTNTAIIDQHFSQRDRLGRLLTALSYNPYLIGVGIDEDTAFLIDGDNCGEVVGSGAVTILDASQLSHSSRSSAESGEALSLVDMRLHVLAEGCTYDMETREATIPRREIQ